MRLWRIHCKSLCISLALRKRARSAPNSQRARPARNICAWTSKANLARLAWESRRFVFWLQGKTLPAASIETSSAAAEHETSQARHCAGETEGKKGGHGLGTESTKPRSPAVTQSWGVPGLKPHEIRKLGLFASYCCHPSPSCPRKRGRSF